MNLCVWIGLLRLICIANKQLSIDDQKYNEMVNVKKLMY